MGERLKGGSPALVVAVLALVAAVAGTAVAEEATTSAKPVTKKKAKKIANKEIDKRFPVGADDIADGAVTTAKLAADAKGSPGYARVSDVGAVSQAKGVVGVSNITVGRYCFDLSFTPQNAVASPDGSASGGGDTAQTLVDPGYAGCAAPFNDATVFMFNAANALEPDGFYVQFD